MTQEEWKRIPDYPKYEISNTGKVRNAYTQRELKPHINQWTGFSQVILSKEKKAYNQYIHRLVIETFKYEERPDDFYEVQHIDGDKSNNNLDNLKWGKRTRNAKYVKANIIEKIERDIRLEIENVTRRILNKYLIADND